MLQRHISLRNIEVTLELDTCTGGLHDTAVLLNLDSSIFIILVEVLSSLHLVYTLALFWFWSVSMCLLLGLHIICSFLHW